MKRVIFFQCRAIRGNWEKKEESSEIREEVGLAKKPSNSEYVVQVFFSSIELTLFCFESAEWFHDPDMDFMDF